MSAARAKPPLPSGDEFVIAVQARVGSSRLPGKILMPAAGKPMLVFLLDRLRASLPWPVLVATSDKAADDATERVAAGAGFPVVRGDEDDVFSRYREVARSTGARHLIRLTGDNPLVDAELISRCALSHASSGADFTSTREIAPDGTVTRYVPKGQSVDVMKSSALARVAATPLSAFEKEHVIPAFFRKEFAFSINILRDARTSAPAVSVDTREDYEKLIAITGV